MSAPDLNALAAHRAAELVGRRALAWSTPAGGYSGARRLVAQLDDGRSVFAKAAVDADTSGWLRTEHQVYSGVHGQFMPEMLAWDESGEWPLLVIEDLSSADWAPIWTTHRIDRVLSALRDVAATPPPHWMESLESRREMFSGWSNVAADPASFLSLGIASEAWLSRSIGALVAAEGRVVLEGDALLHNDIRSDNLCLMGERVVFVDWNWAGRGNPAIDIGAWLPSLQDEGGPPPEDILPDAPGIAACTSGFFAAHAGLPPLGLQPGLRALQQRQLRTALPWAVRELGLPPLDGAKWNG